MLTDVPPRGVPQDVRLLTIAKSMESAMNAGTAADVRGVCAEFLASVSQFYGIGKCEVRVLSARPLRVRESGATELFGDYNPRSTFSERSGLVTTPSGFGILG